MATLYSVQGTKINNLVSSYAALNPDELGGRVRIAYFSYSFVGTEAASDTIRLTKIPAGARIIALLLQNEDCGGTITGEFGDAGDPDRFLAAYALGTATTTLTFVGIRQDTANEDAPGTALVLGFGYKYVAETWLECFLTASTTPTANATFRGGYLYVLD